MNTNYHYDFGWRYSDKENPVIKQKGNSQHGKNLSNSQKLKIKNKKLQVKKSRKINRNRKFNHN